jgi:hypothetical protein
LETKAKLEKIQDIKKLNVQIMSIKSDMSKNEDQLKDLLRYRQFLESLTPNEFWDDKKKSKIADLTHVSLDEGDPNHEEEVLLSTEDQVLFFQTPKQLLDIFAELEENNLALIQNCQETEETLEELKGKILETDIKMYI